MSALDSALTPLINATVNIAVQGGLAWDATGVQFAWDATSLKWASTCQRYYQYKLEGWDLAIPGVHLLFGGIYASALELRHKRVALGDTPEQALIAAVRHALVESWNHERDAEGERLPGTGRPHIFDHVSKTRETLIRSIVWYFEEFKDDALSTVIRADGTPAVEASFRINADDGIILSGHIDRLARDQNGEIFVTDQKTTGQTIGPYFWKGYKPDIQFALYTFAGKAIFDMPVNGVIVDAAQIAVGFTRFARSPVLFTDGELNEFFDESMTIIHRTQENTRQGYFPRNTTACGNYGGCVFREVCSRPLSVRESFLAADFVKKPRWNPLKVR